MALLQALQNAAARKSALFPEKPKTRFDKMGVAMVRTPHKGVAMNDPVRIEIGSVTDAERRYRFNDPAAVWYFICTGRSFERNGRHITPHADEHYPDGRWKVEAVEH